MSDELIHLFHISVREMEDDYSLVVGVIRTDDFRSKKVDIDEPPVEISGDALRALAISLIESAQDSD